MSVLNMCTALYTYRQSGVDGAGAVLLGLVVGVGRVLRFCLEPVGDGALVLCTSVSLAGAIVRSIAA